MTSITTALQTWPGKPKVSSRLKLLSWHRQAGLFAAIFLLMLTVTGVPLMHTETLNLDSRYVGNERLLDWYGIRPAPPLLSFTADGHSITQAGDRLYFDTAFVAPIDGLLIGVVTAAGEILAATSSTLLLLTVDGEVAERLGAAAGVPPGLTAIGRSADETIILRAGHDQFVFDPMSGLIRSDREQRPARWETATPVAMAMQRTIDRGYRGAGLSLERVMLDVHTGRLFGSVGVALVNLSSIAMLVLTFSGVIILWQRRASRRNLVRAVYVPPASPVAGQTAAASQTLADLRFDESSTVLSIEGDPALRRKLSVMGIVKGTEILLAHTAPLGDPRIYSLLGYEFSLRNEDARKIVLQN